MSAGDSNSTAFDAHFWRWQQSVATRNPRSTPAARRKDPPGSVPKPVQEAVDHGRFVAFWNVG